MRKFMAFVTILMFLTMTVSCGKQYVGYKIDHGSPVWCHYINGENHYTKDIGGLVFDFIIKEGQGDGEYIIDGYIDPTKGQVKSWDRMIPEKSRFSMLVANDGVIVDNISFRPITPYGGLGSKMPFTIKYISPEGFDAVTFYWNMYVRG
jgi:hypothetical protein